MDTNDILSATETTKRLIQDENYYKYIFKKTERIVSVVFYILHNVQSDSKTQLHIEDVQFSARAVHDAILQSLEARSYAAEDILRSVTYTLVSLLSKLTVAQVSGVISHEVLGILRNEIDSVIRGLNRYTNEESGILTFEMTPQAETPRRRAAAQNSASYTQRTSEQTVQHPDRRARIKTILEAKGEATIKDISEIVTDISEKTVQRELNAMIEDGLIKRHGERRWSRYSVA